MGELAEIDKRLPVLGVHAHRSGIDNDLGVGVAAQVVVVVLPGAGDDHDLPGSQLGQYRAHREGGPAAAQHQSLLPRHLGSGGVELIQKSVVVGVVPQEGAVGAAEDGVHAADAPGSGGKFGTVLHHRLFIGDGDVQAVELPLFQKLPHLLRLQGNEPVGVVAQQAVDFGRKTVAELSADESAVHQQITSL